MRRLTAMSLAALLCLAATACGGDDSGDASSPSTTKADSPAQAKLRPKLLAESDLPDGWQSAPSSGTADAYEGAPKCLTPDDRGATTVSADFVQSGGFPAIREELRTYSGDQLEAKVDEQVQRAADCGEFDLESDSGDVHGKVTRVGDAPAIGDESATFEAVLTGEGEGEELHMLLAYFRKGDVGVTVQYAQGGTADREAFTTIVQAAAAKL